MVLHVGNNCCNAILQQARQNRTKPLLLVKQLLGRKVSFPPKDAIWPFLLSSPKPTPRREGRKSRRRGLQIYFFPFFRKHCNATTTTTYYYHRAARPLNVAWRRQRRRCSAAIPKILSRVLEEVVAEKKRKKRSPNAAVDIFTAAARFATTAL